MIPIAALSERQSWREDKLFVSAQHVGDLLHVGLATDGGYDGDAPPHDWQQSWFERAIAGFDCKIVDWPTWAVPPDAWPTIVGRLEGLKLRERLLRYERSDPALAALLVAELRDRWSVRVRWEPHPAYPVSVDVDQAGRLMIHGTDAYLDALLRGHAGLALDVPPPLQDQQPTIDPATAIGFVERVASWWPETLSFVQAWVYVD